MPPAVVINGRFELEREARTGGMGAVYRAKDLDSGATVAVKILGVDEALAIERFEREAAVLSSLHHPGIVRYYSHGHTTDGERYLVMEWLEGEDLERRLVRRRLSRAETLTLSAAITDALA